MKRREFVKLASLTTLGSQLGGCIPVFKPPHKNESEIIGGRTINSKLYDVGNGKQRLVSSLKPIHFRSGQNWLDLNPNLIDTGTYFTTISTNLILRVYKNKIGFFISNGRCQYDAQLIEIGGIPVASLSLSINPIIFRNVVIYPDIIPGLDVWISVRPYAITDWQVIKNATVARSFKWQYTKAGDESLVFNSNIRGADAHELSVERNQARISKIIEVTADGFTLEKSWNGEIFVPDPETRVPVWRIDRTRYPVTIDANISQSIASAADDQEDNGSAFNDDAYVLHVRAAGSPDRWSGWIFPTIPQNFGGSAVSSATFTLYCEGDQGPGYNIRIHGVDVDDAAAWADSSNLPSAATRTTASASLTSLTPGTTNDWDILDIAQELADRGDRGGTFDIAFVGDNEAGSSYTGGTFGQYEFQAGGRTPAAIDITYTPSGGSGSTTGTRRKQTSRWWR